MAIDPKKFHYKGHDMDSLKHMDAKEFSAITTARVRRSIKRGTTEQQKIFMKKIKVAKEQLLAGKEPKIIKTHCRDMVILPVMIGLKIGIYNGKEFIDIEITPEMLGHFIGEFTYNRKRIQHQSPGVGATRGSSFVSVK